MSGENNPRYGTTVSAETRDKIRKSNTGKKQSQETIQKRLDHTNRKKQGWSKGLKLGNNKTKSGIESLKTFHKDKVWVNNTEKNIQTYVKDCDVDSYIDNGWKLGMLKRKNFEV